MSWLSNLIATIICCLTDLDFWFPLLGETRKQVWKDYYGKRQSKNE